MLHVRGDSNVADHLSRITPAPAADLASFISVFDKSALFEAIKSAQKTCKEAWYVKLVSQAKKDSKVQFRDDMLCVLVEDYFCPVIPKDSDIIGQILRDLHASALGGHLGFLKLYTLVKRRFFWHNMRRDIDTFCRRCVVCQ